MSDTSTEQTESVNQEDAGTNISEAGEMRLEERAEIQEGAVIEKRTLEANIPAPERSSSRTGRIEHLAARRPVTPLDVDTPEMKERLATLRGKLTTLLADYRWGGTSIEDTTEHIIPLLNTGPILQWHPILIPFIREIDRAGNLVPVWFRVIDENDSADLPPEANPAETEIGRARRIAILMLGNYKSPDISRLLGKLASDPNASIYATQALVKQSTTTAMLALFEALKEAEGWAKVDVVEACLTLKLPRFNELVLVSGLDRAAGLENYIAIPIYRAIPLERYLRGGDVSPRLSQQATLIVWQVIQESLRVPTSAETTPMIFERDLQPLAAALFEGARTLADWQHVVAIHSLASLLGRSWADVSRGAPQNERITEQVYACLPMMPEIERWMNGPGRDILLDTLARAGNSEAVTPVVKTLGELREPRAFALLIKRLDETSSPGSREQALQLSHVLDALGRLGDRRAVQSILQLIERAVNVNERVARPKRRDNLPTGDPDIPASIVLGAALRAFGLLGDRATLDFIIRTAHDFDPFVRVETFESLKRIDTTGDDVRSRIIAREALLDPRDSVVRAAIQVMIQYRDTNATSFLQQIVETRPELAAAAQDALRKLG